MSVLFCAIDPSISCTALSIIRQVGDKYEVLDKVSLNTYKVKYSDRWIKKLDMYEMFAHWLSTRIVDVSFFVFENYSYGSPGHLADLGELNGLFKKYLSDRGKPMDVIAPASVKKIIADSGRASKKEVAEKVRKFLVDKDIEFKNTDESDSVAIGIAYAISMLRIEDEQNEDKGCDKEIRCCTG